MKAIMERFWAKVDKTGPVPEFAPHLGPCWVWIAYIAPDGYGRFMLRHGKPVLAHRFAYEMLLGEIPTGLDLDHLCRNRGCPNPYHTEPVTRLENVRRGRGHGSEANWIETYRHSDDGGGLETATVITLGDGIRVSVIETPADILALLGLPEGLLINHRDGNPTNNDLDNLEVLTHAEAAARAEAAR